MEFITNKKISSFQTNWARYRGFSYLFDNPGNNYSPMKESQGLNLVDCKMGNIELYKALENSINVIGKSLLTNTYLFCPLPMSSYHVTVWGGVNDTNVEYISSQKLKNTFKCLLSTFPKSFISLSSQVPIEPFPIISNVCFEFKKLVKWGNSVLVAVLKPTNSLSDEVLSKIITYQDDLDNRWYKNHQKPKNKAYVPHITLGYFANFELAELATSHLDNWSRVFQDITKGITIDFESISLYGYTDMVTFFK